MTRRFRSLFFQEFFYVWHGGRSVDFPTATQVLARTCLLLKRKAS